MPLLRSAHPAGLDGLVVVVTLQVQHAVQRQLDQRLGMRLAALARLQSGLRHRDVQFGVWLVRIGAPTLVVVQKREHVRRPIAPTKLPVQTPQPGIVGQHQLDSKPGRSHVLRQRPEDRGDARRRSDSLHVRHA